MRDGLDDVDSVLEDVHIADLIAVIGRDGQLLDPQARAEELNDDLRIKMKIVGIQFKRDPGQGIHGVEPVARVKLREAAPQHPILDSRQEPVADILVQRHTALERPKPGHHAGAEYRVRRAFDERGQEDGQQFRCVLPIAVDQRHHVELVPDGVEVAHLLIAAISLVDRVGQDRDRDGSFALRGVGVRGIKRPIVRRVIDDQDFRIVLRH